MKHVLEIGSGYMPGPCFQGVRTYTALDIDKADVAHAARHHKNIAHIIGDARRLPVASKTIDIVIARNVFGDPTWGVSDRGMGYVSLLGAANAANTEPGAALTLLDRHIARNKDQAIAEAARVLKTMGRLIIIEQITPEVAIEYLEQPGAADLLATNFAVEESSLADALPAHYANRFKHAWESEAVWQLTKQ